MTQTLKSSLCELVVLCCAWTRRGIFDRQCVMSPCRHLSSFGLHFIGSEPLDNYPSLNFSTTCGHLAIGHLNALSVSEQRWVRCHRGLIKERKERKRK